MWFRIVEYLPCLCEPWLQFLAEKKKTKIKNLRLEDSKNNINLLLRSNHN